MNPVVFRIGSFDVAWYGVLIAIGVLVAVYFGVRRARQVGVAPEFILDLSFFSILIGFIGSRVFFILTNLGEFSADPIPFIFSRQGYVFFGGLIFAVGFAVWFIRRRRVEPWQVGDVAAPSIAIGHMFGRIGCFFAGCCYGAICPTEYESLGVAFPKIIDPNGDIIYSFAYLDQLARGLIKPEASHSLPVYPVQLYEAGANLLIFGILMLLWQRRRFRGQIFAAYLMAYGVSRFFLEYVRGDYSDPAFFGYLDRGQMSQLISLTAIAAGLTIWYLRRHTPLEVPAGYGTGADEDKKAYESAEPAKDSGHGKKSKSRKSPANAG